MQVKVTRAFRAVLPGDVYPSNVMPGTIVEGRLAEIACEMKCCDLVLGDSPFRVTISASGLITGVIDDRDLDRSGAALVVGADRVEQSANGEATPLIGKPEDNPLPPPSTTRARLKKAYAGPDDVGAPCKIAKGAVIEGAFADALIASGIATAI